MEQIKLIFGLTKPYAGRRWQYLLFNILAALFSVFSIGFLIPFLEVIFSSDELVKPVAVDFSWNSEQLMLYLDYQLKDFIYARGPLKSLYFFSIAIVGMFLLKNLFNYLSFFNMAFVRSGVVRDLRRKVYRKIVMLPVSFYSEERKGDIISKANNDVKEVEWGVVGSVEMLLKHPFYIISYLVSLFLLSWQMTLFAMLILPVSGYIISRLGKRLKSTAKSSQEKLGEVLNVIEETLSGLKVIKAFNAERRVNDGFDKKNDEHFRLMVKLHRKELAASPLSEFLASVVVAAILLFGGRLVLSESVALDGKYFVGYIILFSQLITPAKALTEAFFRVQKASASLSRLGEVLDADVKIFEPDTPKHLDTFQQGVEYKDVSFAYGEDPVLKEVNFSIPKGKTVALVGSSGGGKSTIADLLPRFHDVRSGSISLDGVDIRELPIAELRQFMGIVSQEPVLFNDSIRDNIRLGRPDASDEEVEQACRIANAWDFIEALDAGLDTNIGDRGSKLSGGQRQRIAIARAVLNNPSILILDEATSALDTESETLVQKALEKLMQGRTVLVIAHRLSTIQHADEILVIDKGRIAERGSHEELVAKDGIYRKLYELQSF